MATSVNSNGLTFAGLSTGIDTSKVIDGLTRINQTRIDTLTARQKDIITRQTTFAALQGKLFDLQSKTNGLARAAGGAFDARKADTSDATAVAAAAGTAATPGTYSLTVSSLAQAQQLASQGFADPNAQLKQGTLTLQAGGGAATTVTLDGRNNTLQGLADAINAAGGDVRAAVINDGSASPYRLMLTSAKTGAANGVTVTNNLTVGTGADIDPANAVIQAAADASVTLGSGAGAITVKSATNVVTGLVPGVSLNLLRADATRPVQLTVANDTGGMTQAVQDFVDAYNAAVGFVNDQSKFDAQAQSGGVLLGNSDASALKNDLADALNTVIPGAGTGANRMGSVGLSFKDDGTVAFDADKFKAALAGTGGASVGDIKKLFALSGSSDNPGVTFISGLTKTQPTNGIPYRVNVTAAATRATVIATGPPAGAIVISPPNSQLMMKLNGLSTTGVTIPSGSYTPDQLAAVLQQQINSTADLKGNQVAVGLSADGRFQITTQQYGSAATVAVTGGTALAALGFAGTESAAGTDVAGSFTANGLTEPAAGTGQLLTGKVGNASTEGLLVQSTLTDPGTANVTVNRGLASRVNAVLTKYLDGSHGRLKAVNDTYQASIDDINKTIDKQNALMQDKKDQLSLQFAAMETAVNNLKGIQSQLASLVPTTSK